MPEEYGCCAKPDCLRKVSRGSKYCCASCSTAAEAPEPYEIEPYEPGKHPFLVHSAGCEQRATERGEWPWREAEAMR